MKRAGFTLIELLVGAALTAVVMTVIMMFFQSSRRTSEQTNTYNDVQTQLQAVSQLLAQDLQQAGSSRYVKTSGSSRSWVQVSACGANCTLKATPGSTTPAYDGVVVGYVTSLRPQSTACRSVTYAFDKAQGDETGARLLRTDASCGTPGTPTVLASNVLAFDVAYQCGGGNKAYPDPASCAALTPPSYPRTATYSIVIASGNRLQTSSALTFNTVSNLEIKCPEGRYCYGASQQTLLPNLKDK